ncbi:uncharacterized protein [Haliotis asinina]|uniref:uncharacterized protein n=1 Tax=Haliotis asinina TaxID=109174 RepID=UPI003531D22D
MERPYPLQKQVWEGVAASTPRQRAKGVAVPAPRVKPESGCVYSPADSQRSGRAHSQDEITGATSIPEKASILATHFASVSSSNNFSEEFTKSEKPPQRPKQPPGEQHAYNQCFSVEEFRTAIHHKKGTSPGEDMVSYEMLKRLPDSVAKVVVQLYNLIWDRGEVPAAWKHAAVIPLLKPGKEKASANSYRPISLTSNLCKSMEAMVNIRLKHHLETNGHLSHDQSGFRSNRSCLDHIFRLESDIRLAQVKKEYLAAVFLDFSKAFDMVWHDGLLLKLENVGVRGKMANYVQSFLQERSISVLLGDHLSERHRLDNGTPQGSIISPTLFNIMIDDLFEHVPRDSYTNTSKFADDGAVWVRHRELSKIQAQLREALDGVEQWCDKWGFTISPEKTVGVVFKRKGCRVSHTPCLKLKGKEVKFEKSAKFLGVTFDQHLTWAKHIDNITQSCQKDLNAMRAVSGSSWGANSETLLTLYKSLIRSKIDYGCEAYHSASQSALSRLENIQYQALKLVTGAATCTSHQALLVETGELPLHLRREKLTLNYWSRCSNPLVTRLWEEKLYSGRTKAWLKKRPNTTPGGLRVIQLRREHGCDQVEPPTQPMTVQCPPWRLRSPNVDTTLTNEPPKSENPMLLRVRALSRIDTVYEDSAHIYTDGSKDPVRNRTAYGILIHTATSNHTISARLPDGQSVYTAELEAIHHALRYCRNLHERRVVILSDSLSAIQSLATKHSSSRPDTIHEILVLIQKLRQENEKEVTLCWIPSHVGIPGNERADKLARQALELNVSLEHPYSKSEIRSMIQNSITSKWQRLWDTSDKGRWLHQLRPSVKGKLPGPSQNRRVDIMITRLRLGTTKTSYKDCQTCHTKATVPHIMLDCLRFDTIRQTLKEETKLDTLTAKQLLAHTEHHSISRYGREWLRPLPGRELRERPCPLSGSSRRVAVSTPQQIARGVAVPTPRMKSGSGRVYSPTDSEGSGRAHSQDEVGEWPCLLPNR